MNNFLQVTTTTSDRETASTIAERLVEQHLAACVQIVGPIESTYRWEGKIAHDQEWMCVIKTGNTLFAAVERAIQESHPYEEPEIIATPIVAGSHGYLDWLRGALDSET